MVYKLSNGNYSNSQQMTSLRYDFRVISSLINFIHHEGRVNKQKHCSPSCRRRTAVKTSTDVHSLITRSFASTPSTSDMPLVYSCLAYTKMHSALSCPVPLSLSRTHEASLKSFISVAIAYNGFSFLVNFLFFILGRAVD